MKKRFLGIPIIAIIAILALVAAVGSTVAYYSLFNGGAQVLVTEGITATVEGTGVASTWDGTNWGVNLYPGESSTLTVTLNNAGSVAIYVPVTATLTGQPVYDKGGQPLVFSCSGDVTVGAKSVSTIVFTATAPADVMPGWYTYAITWQR